MKETLNTDAMMVFYLYTIHRVVQSLRRILCKGLDHLRCIPHTSGHILKGKIKQVIA